MSDLGVSSIADYGSGPVMPQRLLFGYGAIDAERIDQALSSLGALLSRR